MGKVTVEYYGVTHAIDGEIAPTIGGFVSGDSPDNMQDLMISILYMFYVCQEFFHGKPGCAIYNTYKSMASSMGVNEGAVTGAGILGNINHIRILMNKIVHNIRCHELGDNPDASAVVEEIIIQKPELYQTAVAEYGNVLEGNEFVLNLSSAVDDNVSIGTISSQSLGYGLIDHFTQQNINLLTLIDDFQKVYGYFNALLSNEEDLYGEVYDEASMVLQALANNIENLYNAYLDSINILKSYIEALSQSNSEYLEMLSDFNDKLKTLDNLTPEDGLRANTDFSSDPKGTLDRDQSHQFFSGLEYGAAAGNNSSSTNQGAETQTSSSTTSGGTTSNSDSNNETPNAMQGDPRFQVSSNSNGSQSVASTSNSSTSSSSSSTSNSNSALYAEKTIAELQSSKIPELTNDYYSTDYNNDKLNSAINNNYITASQKELTDKLYSGEFTRDDIPALESIYNDYNVTGIYKKDIDAYFERQDRINEYGSLIGNYIEQNPNLKKYVVYDNNNNIVGIKKNSDGVLSFYKKQLEEQQNQLNIQRENMKITANNIAQGIISTNLATKNNEIQDYNRQIDGQIAKQQEAKAMATAEAYEIKVPERIVDNIKDMTIGGATQQMPDNFRTYSVPTYSYAQYADTNKDLALYAVNQSLINGDFTPEQAKEFIRDPNNANLAEIYDKYYNTILPMHEMHKLVQHGSNSNIYWIKPDSKEVQDLNKKYGYDVYEQYLRLTGMKESTSLGGRGIKTQNNGGKETDMSNKYEDYYNRYLTYLCENLESPWEQ